VDDISHGFSRLTAVAELEPDYIKIDRPCIKGALKSDVWRKVLGGIVKLGESINSKTIGEGIETERERHLLEQYSIDYGQGFYFGKPTGLVV